MSKIEGNAYLTDEAEYVRVAYDQYAREILSLEKFVLVITGAIWAWCFDNLYSELIFFILWVPVFAQFIFGIRARTIFYNMTAARKHLETIEKRVDLSGPGWSECLRNRDGRSATGFTFWLILTPLSIALVPWFVWLSDGWGCTFIVNLCFALLWLVVFMTFKGVRDIQYLVSLAKRNCQPK